MTTPSHHFDSPADRRLHEELRGLPELAAPDSLIPNVMAAIRARQEQAAVAWYRQPATTWPWPARCALGLGALAVFVAVAFGLQALWPQAVDSAQSSPLAGVGENLGGFVAIVRSLLNAFALVLRESLSSPWVIGAIAAAACSFLTLFGAGSALWRVVMHPRSE